MINKKTVKRLSEIDLLKIAGGCEEVLEDFPVYTEGDGGYTCVSSKPNKMTKSQKLIEFAKGYAKGLVSPMGVLIYALCHNQPEGAAEGVGAALGITTLTGLAAFLGVGISEATHAINRNKNKIK